MFFVAFLCGCQLSGCRRAAWLRSPFVRTAAAPPAAAAEKKKEKKRKKKRADRTDGVSTQTAQPLDAAPSQRRERAHPHAPPRARSAPTERPSAHRPPSARPQHRAARQVSHRALRTATRANSDDAHTRDAHVCAVIAASIKRGEVLAADAAAPMGQQRGSSFSFSFVREPRRRPPPPSLTPLCCAGLCVLCSMMHAAS